MFCKQNSDHFFVYILRLKKKNPGFDLKWMWKMHKNVYYVKKKSIEYCVTKIGEMCKKKLFESFFWLKKFLIANNTRYNFCLLDKFCDVTVNAKKEKIRSSWKLPDLQCLLFYHIDVWSLIKTFTWLAVLYLW